MCAPLTTIINRYLETGEVSSSLKLAKVVPIYKSKNKEECNNYIHTCIYKILENIILKTLYNVLLLQHLFYKRQYESSTARLMRLMN